MRTGIAAGTTVGIAGVLAIAVAVGASRQS